jgi:hypothetical protein
MSAIKIYKGIAALCLLLAVAAVVLALQASQRRIAIQGPSALAVLPDGTVWLGVEQALWRFDAAGVRTAVVPAGSPGLPGAPANLVLHPGGALVATVRDDPTLYFLDPATGTLQSRLAPQWPADLQRHSARATVLAFHPDGRFAIATGGGHAVAAFDAQGRFLARTAAGTYEFTNGLWWEGDSLWTTDTNRFALVQLDGRTLREQTRTVLADSPGRGRFLGVAEPPASPAAAADAPPRVTLVRHFNGMVQGDVVDVMPDGRQRLYPSQATLEPRDLKRRGAELLVVDGASYSVKRFSAARQALPDFGDPASRQALKASLQQRRDLHQRYVGGIALALVLFTAGLLLALRAQSQEKRERLAALGADLSQLGSLRLEPRRRARILLSLAWPLLLSGVVVGAIALVPRELWRDAGLRYGIAAALAFGLVLPLVGAALFARQLRRAGHDPEVDAFMNQAAVAALEQKDAFWKLRLPGERPRETLMLNQTWGGRHWLVLTDKRLLVFTATFTDYTLKSQHARRDIMGAAVVPPPELSRAQRWHASLAGGSMMRIEMRDGGSLEGVTASPMTARRFAALVGHAPGFEAAGTLLPTRRAPGQVEDQGEAARQALASLLVPGLGQWMQGRSGTALLMFLAWAGVLLAAALPVVWTLWAPRAAVSPHTVAVTATSYAVVCLTAAFDAWRMRERVV